MTSGGGGCTAAGKLQELNRLWRTLNNTQKKKLLSQTYSIIEQCCLFWITWFLTECASIKQHFSTNYLNNNPVGLS